HARTTAPRREIDSRLLRDVFEFPSPEVAIQRIAMRDALARRSELRRSHQVDVEPSITVVIEQRDTAAGRFEDVILGGATAIHRPGQLRADTKGQCAGTR